MELIVKKIENSEIQNMKEKFSESFLEWINQPYYNQKLFKYYTYKRFFNIEDENLLKKIDTEHYYQWQHVSTSYTWDWIFLAIADEKIGIDLEEIKERSQEMLDFFSDKDYALVWEKNRENFFLLWTAEECLIKTSDACFFEDGKKVIIKRIEKKEQIIAWIKFSWQAIMSLHENEYKVYSWIEDNKIYSIWIWLEKNQLL
jgi:phosphopantetheinyl transferase